MKPLRRSGTEAGAPVPVRRPSPPRLVRIAAGALVLVLVAVAVLLVESRTGKIPYRGGVVRIPLRAGSVPVRVSEGRARYVEPGSPDIKPLLEARGPELGWQFLDQLGAIYSLRSTRVDGLRVVLVTEPVMSRFVQVDCYVEEDTAAAGASPPPLETP